MAKRFKMNRRSSKKLFRRASGVKGRNFATTVRGGYRL